MQYVIREKFFRLGEDSTITSVETTPGEDDILILASVLTIDLAEDQSEQVSHIAKKGA